MDIFEYERLKNEVEGWPDDTTEVVDDGGRWLTNKVRRVSMMISASSSKIKEKESGVAKRLVLADEDFNDLLRVVEKFDKLVKETKTLISLLKLRCANQAVQPILLAVDKVPESRVTSSIPVEPKLFGREETEKKLLKLLQQDSNGSGTTSFSVVSVVGVGGVGKTTLAQFVFNHQSLEDKFDVKAWVCVSNNFSTERLLKNILEVATGIEKPPDFNNYTTLEKIQRTLMNSLNSKKFLIVLDDVWKDMEVKWATLRSTFSNGTTGSKILITSRIQNVARAMGSHEKQHIKLDSLEFEDFWPFFEQCAFRNEDSRNNTQLKHIGEQIARKLGGLPLAAKAIGGLLYQNLNINYWKQVLYSKRWKERDNKVLPSLKLSYDHLPLHLKRCFVYCCLFPKDYQYDTNTLQDIWVVLSCIRLEDKRKRLVNIETEYINELVNRSILHDQCPTDPPEYKTYVIHDLLHDMAEKIIGDEVHRVENDESLSKEIPRNIRHLYIKSTYNDLDLVLQKIAPKQLQSLIYVVAKAASEEERAWKLSKQTIQNIEGLRFLSFKVEIFSENEMRFWNNIGDMKHLRCANFAFKDSFSTHIISPISLWKPYQLQILRSSGSECAGNSWDSLHKLINLQVVQLKNCQFITPYLSRLKSLEMIPGGIFSVDGKNGNDIGQLGELDNIGGTLTLQVEVELNKAEASKANLNRKPYLADLKISGSINDEALKALQPHINLEKLEIRQSRNITVAPKWLHMLFNLTKLYLSYLPNLQGLDPDLGCHLFSLEILQFKSLPSVRQIEVVASGHAFPSLVCIAMADMENMEGWSLQSCNQKGAICFPKLSKIEISKCPKLLKSGGSFPNCIICPFPSPNCNIKLRVSSIIYSYLEHDDVETELKIDEESFLPAIDDGNDQKNNMLFRCANKIIINKISSTRLPAASLNKFQSLEKLTIQRCNNFESLGSFADDLFPCATNTLNIIQCSNLIFLSTANILQTIFPCLKTIDIQVCSELKSLAGHNIDIKSENHILLPTVSVKTLIIKHCRKLKFLSLPILFPSLETLIIEDCQDLLSLGELNDDDDDDSNELPPSINTLIIKHCYELMLSSATLQILPSIQLVEIEACNEIIRQQLKLETQ